MTNFSITLSYGLPKIPSKLMILDTPVNYTMMDLYPNCYLLVKSLSNGFIVLTHKWFCLVKTNSLSIGCLIYPFLTISSAFRIAHPAAPLIVLWERMINFQSKRGHSLSRPIDIAIPPSRERCSFG